MPIAIDPDRTFTISLASDEHKPEADRPAFTFRYLTGRQWIALSELLDTIEDKKKTASEMAQELAAKIGAAMVSWSNVPVDFARDAMLDVFTVVELFEIGFAIRERTTVATADKKKLELQSPLDAASSARAAA